MKIAGVSIILILGIVNMLLVCFQLLTGLHTIRVPLGVHRKTGIALFICALLHAALALIAGS
jgi:hypothetical protein